MPPAYIRRCTLFFFFLAVFTSCLDDDTPETFYTTLATVKADGEQWVLDSDTYGMLVPENPKSIPAAGADSTGQRVLVGVQFATDYGTSGYESGKTSIRIMEIIKVLTKKAEDFRVEGTEDIFGNDPVQISAASVSKEHLNIQFTGFSGGNDILHRISLILDERSVPDDDGLVRVELRHNMNGDTAESIFKGTVSYTLESIPECQDTRFKGFRIVYNSGMDNLMEYILRTGS